jgi:hypothetical protein
MPELEKRSSEEQTAWMASIFAGATTLHLANTAAFITAEGIEHNYSNERKRSQALDVTILRGMIHQSKGSGHQS